MNCSYNGLITISGRLSKCQEVAVVRNESGSCVFASAPSDLLIQSLPLPSEIRVLFNFLGR